MELAPGGHSPGDVGHMVDTGASEQAGRKRRAVAPFAHRCDGAVARNLRGSFRQIAERDMHRSVDVAGVPLAIGAHIDDQGCVARAAAAESSIDMMA